MKETIIKIHLERDFSYVEFDATIDIETGYGMPEPEILSRLWAVLPAKEINMATPAGKSTDKAQHREPPATAAQRRLLEKAGEWKEDITKAEATKILTRLGY